MKDIKAKQQTIKNTGSGIAFGAALGILIGLLFMDGNITKGLIFGVSVGLVFGILMDMLQEKIVFSLAGMSMRMVTGLFIGLLVDLYQGYSIYQEFSVTDYEGMVSGLTNTHSFWLICVIVIGAIGLVIGTAIGVKKIEQKPLMKM